MPRRVKGAADSTRMAITPVYTSARSLARTFRMLRLTERRRMVIMVVTMTLNVIVNTGRYQSSRGVEGKTGPTEPWDSKVDL